MSFITEFSFSVGLIILITDAIDKTKLLIQIMLIFTLEGNEIHYSVITFDRFYLVHHKVVDRYKGLRDLHRGL